MRARTTTNLSVGLGSLALLLLGAQTFSQSLTLSTADQVYTPVTPCRFVDGINAADRVTSVTSTTQCHLKSC